MSSPPLSNSRLVQKLITSYFPLSSTHPSFIDLSTDFDSVLTTTDGYVSETPESKQGNIAFYIGICNTIENSPSRVVRSSVALFERAGVEEQESLHHSPTTTCESVNRRTWRFVYTVAFSFIAFLPFTICCSYQNLVLFVSNVSRPCAGVGEVLNLCRTIYCTTKLKCIFFSQTPCSTFLPLRLGFSEPNCIIVGDLESIISFLHVIIGVS